MSTAAIIESERTGLATVAETAEFLRLSKTAIYEMMDAGRLKYCRIPGTGSRVNRRVPWDVLRELVATSMTGE